MEAAHTHTHVLGFELLQYFCNFPRASWPHRPGGAPQRREVHSLKKKYTARQRIHKNDNDRDDSQQWWWLLDVCGVVVVVVEDGMEWNRRIAMKRLHTNTTTTKKTARPVNKKKIELFFATHVPLRSFQ